MLIRDNNLKANGYIYVNMHSIRYCRIILNVAHSLDYMDNFVKNQWLFQLLNQDTIVLMSWFGEWVKLLSLLKRAWIVL